VLFVEDEASIYEPFSKALTREGFEPVVARTAARALELAEDGDFAIVLLDLTLPDGDGRDICRALRRTSSVPILMLTARGTEADRIVGLELGADDYVVKPFSGAEVIARIRAVLRRYASGAVVAETPAGQRYGFDGWLVDLARREVRDPAGAARELTTAEFNLLALFVQKPGRVLSRDELMDLLKGHDWTPMDRSIDALVARLRKKLEPDSERPMLVKTVRGVGYAFAGAVKKL